MDGRAETSLCVKKKIYPSNLLLKTAYAFLDEAYIHFEEAREDWIVCITPKEPGADFQNLLRRFENELISQTVRMQVYNKTKTLRELLMARAMTTSMIDQEDPLEKIKEDELSDISDDELKDILTEWFTKNGQPNS